MVGLDLLPRLKVEFRVRAANSSSDESLPSLPDCGDAGAMILMFGTCRVDPVGGFRDDDSWFLESKLEQRRYFLSPRDMKEEDDRRTLATCTVCLAPPSLRPGRR